MDNFIDKILDEYYSRKLTKDIQKCLLFKYDLDVRTEWEKDVVRIQIKKRKYKDNQYYTVFLFKCDTALRYLIRFDEVKDALKDSIKYYFEKEM